MRILISDDGQTYPLDTFGLAKLFGFLGSAEELARYAIRNCGAAMLDYRERSCRIHARPGMLSPRAFETLVCYLVEGPETRIVIFPEMPEAGFRDIFVNLSDAIARLDQYRTEPRLTLSGLRFSANPSSISRLYRAVARPTLQATYRMWQRSRGHICYNHLKQLLKNPLGADLLLTRQGSDNMPITETLPHYINFWGPTDRESSIGKPMVDHPDQVYATDAARGFIELSRAKDPEPLLETIDAIIAVPGGPTSTLRYDRLLLPWRSPSGEKFVSSTGFTRVERPLASAP